MHERAIGPRHPGLFFILAAGDHQPCGDFQLAEYVALLVRFHGRCIGWHVLVQHIGIQRLHVARRFDQPTRVGERRQADARARGQLDPVHSQAQALGEIAEQAEAVAGFHDEEARPVDGRDLVQEVVERCAFAGAGGAEQEQVRVHLPIQAVERVKGDRPAASIEERITRMARALAAAPGR